MILFLCWLYWFYMFLLWLYVRLYWFYTFLCYVAFSCLWFGMFSCFSAQAGAQQYRKGHGFLTLGCAIAYISTAWCVVIVIFCLISLFVSVGAERKPTQVTTLYVQMKQLLTCEACITEVALQATYSGWQVHASFIAQLVRACTTTQLAKCCCRVCGAVLGPQNYCGSVHATHHLSR